MPAKGERNERSETPSWGIEPVPERLRVLGTFDGFLLWANLSVSLLVIVAGAFLVLPADQYGLALSLPVALAAIVAAAVVGNVLLGLGGTDRRRRARAEHGAPARAARAARLVPADRAEHPPVPRLVGVRADHHRDRRERALEAGARLRRRLVLEDRVRHRRDGARVPRPGRVRAQVRAQVRGLGRDRLAALHLVVVAARPASRCGSGTAAARTRSGPASTSSSHRSSAGRRSSPTTPASHAPRAGGFWSAGARLLRADDPAVRARRGDRAVPLDQRRPGPADGGRRRRRRERAGPARADGRRERRGVRERVLGRRQPAEPAAARAAARARRRGRARGDRRAR